MHGAKLKITLKCLNSFVRGCSNTRVQRSFSPHGFTCSQLYRPITALIFLPVNQSMIVRLLWFFQSFSSSALTRITVLKLVGTVFYKNYSISFVNISTSCLSSVQFYLPSCHRRGKEATSNEIVSIQYHEVDHRSAVPKPVKTQISARIILFF